MRMIVMLKALSPRSRQHRASRQPDGCATDPLVHAVPADPTEGSTDAGS